MDPDFSNIVTHARQKQPQVKTSVQVQMWPWLPEIMGKTEQIDTHVSILHMFLQLFTF